MRADADQSGRLSTMVKGEQFRMLKKQIWQYDEEKHDMLKNNNRNGQNLLIR